MMNTNHPTLFLKKRRLFAATAAGLIALAAAGLVSCGPRSSSPSPPAPSVSYLGPDGAADIAVAGGVAYVSDNASSRIFTLDLASKKFTGQFNVWCKPRRMAITPDGLRMYVTHDVIKHVCPDFESKRPEKESTDRSWLSIVDLETKETLQVVIFGDNNLANIAMDPVKNRAYVAARDGFDQKIGSGFKKRWVAVFDLTDDSLIGEFGDDVIKADSSEETPSLSDLFASPDGETLYLANKQASDNVNTFTAVETAGFTHAQVGGSDLALTICLNSQDLRSFVSTGPGDLAVFYSCNDAFGIVEDDGSGAAPFIVSAATPWMTREQTYGEHPTAVAVSEEQDCLGTGAGCAYVALTSQPVSESVVAQDSNIMTVSLCSQLPVNVTPMVSPISSMQVSGDTLVALGALDNTVSFVDIENPTRKEITYQSGPGQEQVVFAGDREGSLDLYRMNVDGTDQTRLTGDGYDDRWPRIDNVGKTIVYSTAPSDSDPDGYDIAVIGVDGTGRKTLTSNSHGEKYPVWTSLGRIAYVADSDGDGSDEIWRMDANGSNETLIYEAGAGEIVLDLAANPTAAEFFLAVGDGAGADGLRVVNETGAVLDVSGLTDQSLSGVSGVDWSANGNILIYAYQKSATEVEIGLWDTTVAFGSKKKTVKTKAVFRRPVLAASTDFFIMTDEESIVFETRKQGMFSDMSALFRTPLTCDGSSVRNIDPDLGPTKTVNPVYTSDIANYMKSLTVNRF